MPKLQGVIRNVDNLGRVVLPIGMRKALKIDGNTKVIVSIDKENKQIIVKNPLLSTLKK